MKDKIISIAVICVLLCFLVLPVVAAGNAISARADLSALERGTTVVVTVEFACEEAVSTVSALLEYDDEVFTVAEGKCNDQAGAVFTSYNEEHSGLALLFSEAQPREGLLGTFTLQVRDAAKLGETAITLKPVFKAGAETLAADPVQLRFTVGCIHSWDAQGICAKCKEQRPAEPSVPPVSEPPVATEPVESGASSATTPVAALPPETTGYDVDGTEKAVSPEETMEAETTDAVISNQGVPKIEKNQPIIFWTLLILAVLGGGIIVAVLLTKKKR